MFPELAKQIPNYKVKFPTTEADAKKVLSYFRRQYRSELNRPILENFKEKFDSCVMTVIVNNKVQEVQRMLPINGKPNPDTFLHSAKNLHASIAHHGYTLAEVIWVMEETDIRRNEAIGKVLARM